MVLAPALRARWPLGALLFHSENRVSFGFDLMEMAAQGSEQRSFDVEVIAITDIAAGAGQPPHARFVVIAEEIMRNLLNRFPEGAAFIGQSERRERNKHGALVVRAVSQLHKAVVGQAIVER